MHRATHEAGLNSRGEERRPTRGGAVALAAVVAALSTAAATPAMASDDSPALFEGASAHGLKPTNVPVLVEAAADLAARPDRPNESWYVIAHVAAGGHRYGFLAHYLTMGDAAKGFASSAVSITDETTGWYSRSESLLPPRTGLSQSPGVDIHTPNISWTGNASQMTLQATVPEGRIDVALRPRGAVLYNLGTGYFPMFADPQYPNHEYGLPAIDTSGTLTIEGRTLKVEGQSWLDHQWGPLPDFATTGAGWTWLGLTLSNGVKISLWKTRLNTTNTWATVLAPDGTHTIAEATLTPGTSGTWTSPDSHVTYPSHWTATIPGLRAALKINATAKNQELLVPGPRYEGSAAVAGIFEGRPVTGSTYVEIAGAQ
jgi:predicted secreted hydrolase